MSRVEEIEEAIAKLEPDEFRRVALWFHKHEDSLWDEQMDSDSQAGKLDFLFEEAQRESSGFENQ